MSNSEERVHMCKISQLITGSSDSWRTSLLLPVHHMMLFFPLATQASHLTTSPRSAEGNDTATAQDLWEIHSRLPPCLQNTLTPTKELLQSPVVYKAAAHLLSVTESLSQAACLLWQVLIENQTQVAFSLDLKASLCPSVATLTWITLDCDTNHKMYLSQYKNVTMCIGELEKITKLHQIWHWKDANICLYTLA